MKYNLRSKLYLRNEKNENLRVDFIAFEEIFRKNIKIAARIMYIIHFVENQHFQVNFLIKIFTIDYTKIVGENLMNSCLLWI